MKGLQQNELSVGRTTLEVEDFEKAVSELRDANVEFHFGPYETPVCHMAFVRDPDGNSVGIHKRKPQES